MLVIRCYVLVHWVCNVDKVEVEWYWCREVDEVQVTLIRYHYDVHDDQVVVEFSTELHDHKVEDVPDVSSEHLVYQFIYECWVVHEVQIRFDTVQPQVVCDNWLFSCVDNFVCFVFQIREPLRLRKY